MQVGHVKRSVPRLRSPARGNRNHVPVPTGITPSTTIRDEGGISGQKEDRQTGSGESGFAAFFDVAGLPVARILRARIGWRGESCDLLGTASKIPDWMRQSPAKAVALLQERIGNTLWRIKGEYDILRFMGIRSCRVTIGPRVRGRGRSMFSMGSILGAITGRLGTYMEGMGIRVAANLSVRNCYASSAGRRVTWTRARHQMYYCSKLQSSRFQVHG